MEYIDKFKSWLAAKNFTERTIKFYEFNIKRFFSEYLFPANQIAASQVQEYIDKLKEKKFTSHTISGYLYSLKYYYDYLERENLTLVNVFDHIHIPKINRTLPKGVLSEAEMKDFLKSFDLSNPQGIRNRAILEVLYSTAIRKGELIRLKLSDLEINNGYLRVMEGKGRKDRLVPLGEKAIHYLKMYLEKVRPGLCKELDEEHVFLSRNKAPLGSEVLNLMIREAAKKINLQNVTAHGIRRTAITHMLKNGANPVYVSRIAGHEDIRSLSPYIRFNCRDVKEMHRTKHPGELKA